MYVFKWVVREADGGKQIVEDGHILLDQNIWFYKTNVLKHSVSSVYNMKIAVIEGQMCINIYDRTSKRNIFL